MFTISDSYEAYSSTWNVSNAIDGNYYTDYASKGGGTDTYITFKFNQPYVFSAVDVTDRTQSGSATNTGAPTYGLFDFVTQYELIFSMTPDFTDPANLTLVVDNKVPTGTPELKDFQTSSAPNFEAQYVEYKVLATNPGGSGENPGLAEISFNGVAAAAPEPASLACIGTGLCALGFFARKRRKSRA
jgi:hypothetical protein